MSNQPLNPSEQDACWTNRATISESETAETCCDPENMVFALQDRYHQFSMEITTILQCLHAAELEGAVPRLPDSWWLQIINRYPVQREPL